MSEETREKYKAFILKVDTLDELGYPDQCTLIRDDSNVELAGGEWFIVAMIKADVLHAGCGFKYAELTPGPGNPKRSVL